MIDILNRYLLQHTNINIPGLGTLYLERVPAHSSMDGGEIFPPAYTLRFDKYFDAPDKAFFTYLASQKKIPDYEAIKLYNQFAQDIRSAIKYAEKAVWKDMGVFMKDDSGDIIFEPDSSFLHPFAPVSANRIQHNLAIEEAAATVHEEPDAPVAVPDETVVAVMKKDPWWVYALVMGGIGMVILFYQLYRHGYSWQAIANHQPLH